MTKTISIKFPMQDLRKIPDENVSRFFRDAAYEKIARMQKPTVKHKSPLAKKLLAARQKFIDSGGELLDAEGIARERRERRGGVA